MKDYSILKGYLDKEGKFAQMPGKREKKKLALMLQFLSGKFNPEQQYTEKEINEILNAHHSFGDNE